MSTSRHAPTEMQTSAPESSITPLRRLLDETSDLVDSPPFTHVLTRLLDAGFSVLVDQKLATQAYKISPDSVPSTRIQELVGDEMKAKFANILAVVSRQAHNIGNGVPNEYLQAMEAVRDLEGFAAIVYSSNFEFEAPGSGAGAAGTQTHGEADQAARISMMSRTMDGKGETVGAESGFESAWENAVDGKGVAKNHS